MLKVSKFSRAQKVESEIVLILEMYTQGELLTLRSYWTFSINIMAPLLYIVENVYWHRDSQFEYKYTYILYTALCIL